MASLFANKPRYILDGDRSPQAFGDVAGHDVPVWSSHVCPANRAAGIVVAKT
ncbi:MAG: hypothetical protein NVS4B8_29190 [Herpetosiphon sp.]